VTLYHIFTSGRKGARVLSRQPLIVILRPSCRLSVNFYCQLGYSDGWCGRGQGERGPRKGPFFCNRVVQCGRRCDWGSVYQPFDIVRSHSFDEWFTGIWPPGQSLRFSSVQPGWVCFKAHPSRGQITLCTRQFQSIRTVLLPRT